MSPHGGRHEYDYLRITGCSAFGRSGNAEPAALRLSFPVIIVPTEAIILRTASAWYQLEKGQFISFRHAEENMSIDTAENTEFAPVYVVSYQSYQLTEKTQDSLLYHKSEEHLPKQGSVMEFPRHALGLLESLMEQLQQASWDQIAARVNLKLDELLRSIFVSNHCGVSYMTQEPSIQQALTYIHQHFDAAVSRSFMAQLTGFNPSYFSSLFRRETGWGFAEYLNRIRIDEVKRRLLSTTDSLQEIAYQTGFADGSYLGKMFKKVVGMTPSAFRQKRDAKRVAGMQFLGALLAVGIKPIASTQDVLRSSLLLCEQLEGIAEMEDIHSVEVLKRLAPEIILAPTYYYNYPEVLKELERIAPVIMLDWGTLNKLEEVRVIGRLFGRIAQAESWITGLKRKALESRNKIAQFMASGATVGMYELRYDQKWLIPHEVIRSVFNLYDLLELTPPAIIDREVLGPSTHRFIDEADLPVYAANHMFLIVTSSEIEAFRARMMTHSIWQQLANEYGCRFYILKLEEFWMDEGVSLEMQMDIILELLVSGQKAKSTIFPIESPTSLHRRLD